MIVVRPIKPRKRNIRVIGELGNEALAVSKEIKASLEEDVATWVHKPEFVARVTVTQRRIVIDVSATGDNAQIYEYVDKGTRAHDIYPRKRGGVLRFKWGGPGSYTPKTEPGRRGSTKSYRTGEIQHFKHVRHPGTKPRYFARKIRQLYSAELPRRFQEAINRSAGRIFK